MTCREFFTKFIRVSDPRRRGRLARLELHPEQTRVIDAVDQRDADSRRQFGEVVISWIKKAGKSTTLAGLALYGLVADELNGEDREILLVASDLSQSKDVTFTTAKRIVLRDPWLSARCRTLSTEIVFTESVTNHRTGGAYKVDHVLKAVPRDVRGLHGANQSMTIIDEYWSQDDYELAEAVAPSPARFSPITIYASYAGLLSQQRPGVPWFDLMARAKRGDDARLFLSHLSGPDAWQQVPWITKRWVDQMRASLPAVKFRRLVENRPAVAEATFLTVDEVDDALQAHPGPQGPRSDRTYVGGLDLGVTHDWAALVIGYVDGDTRFQIEHVEFWRPTAGRPVSMVALEERVIALARLYRLQRLRVDQWQAVGLKERLVRARVPAELVTLGPSQLDTLATLTKDAFVQRLIGIPREPPELREQLEALQAEEMKTRNARRDLVRFQSGKGKGAAGHDDLAIALALALEIASPNLGVPSMPEMSRCNELERGNYRAQQCYLFGGYAVGSGYGCYTCPAHQAAQQQFEVWRKRQPEPEREADRVHLQDFARRYMRPNRFVSLMAMQRAINQHEGYY